jgi:arsenite methyltransferase
MPDLTPHNPTQDLYFEMLAQMDLTKHLGSLQPTHRLIEIFDLHEGSVLLDVGCGVGFTPCYLARRYGCRVVGIDLYESMIERATVRAKREKLDHLIEFRVADAQDLPFEDGFFDAAMAESVISFVPDKTLALSECVRVTKAGGYVGFTEATWKGPPTEMMLSFADRIFGDNFEMYDAEGWRRLVEGAGLEDVVAECHDIVIRDEAKGRIQRIGCRNILGAVGNVFRLSVRQPQVRRFLKNAMSEPKTLMDNWGYGIYAGRKPL